MTYNAVSWENYRTNEKFETYNEYYNWVINKIQYSFMLKDESAIQIFLEGERSGKKDNYVLVKGKMAYLPRPDKYSEYFRFDVDYKKANDYDHTAYHAHFGYRSKDVRFSLYQFPTPSEFVKFVLFIDYGYHYMHFNSKNFFDDLDLLGNKYNHNLSFVVNK
jgi:hypothetical protein